jgi:pyrroloquinoline-quinone synthase
MNGGSEVDLLERIDTMIDERHVLGHPFYRAWVAGTLPTEALQEYARQYYGFESTFPRFLSTLHARSERAGDRQALLDNLWDEEHGDSNHAELWLRFAEGLGVSRNDVLAAARNLHTKALIDTYWRVCREGPVAAGVAAVYAYERQVPQVAQAKIDGLRMRYGIEDDRTLAFFEIHASLDVEHSEAERRMLSTVSEEDEASVVEGAGAALDGWWGFLDAVTPNAAG